MICPGCNQELTPDAACPNCQQPPPDNDSKAVGGSSATASPSTSSPPDGAASPRTGTTGAAPSGDPNPAIDGDETPQAGSGNQGSINAEGVHIDAGGNVTFANVSVTTIRSGDESPKTDEEKSLFDYTKPLSPRPHRRYKPSLPDLKAMVTGLLTDRLVLISSSFTEYALDTAWEIIDGMRLSAERTELLLAFHDAGAKSIEFSVENLCYQRTETETETVLLVDALGSLANTFPASVLGHSGRVAAVTQDLFNNKLFLVVLVNHEYALTNKLAQPQLYKSFSYWNIPFLEPFLQNTFPSEEHFLAEITLQRKNGKWEDDDLAFTHQVINYYHSERLPEIINSGGPKDPESSAESLLQAASPVDKAVLYTATFFNEITSPEFCRVVETILDAQPTATVTSGTNTDGTVSEKSEVAPRVSWHAKKDEIFSRLLVETTNTTDSPRTVSLTEFNLAEPLRKLFEKQHRFYVMDQFNALLLAGIFFYPSLRLARNTTELAVDLAQLYPDEFAEGWIVGLVKRIRDYFASDAKDSNEDPMFCFLSNTQPNASNVAFARVAEVCRRFLELAPHKAVVPNSLEYLIKTRYYAEVLWLVKQLKFNADFDDWYWLKQLLHRGDGPTQILTYYYINSYLKQMGTRVYDGLKKIQTWLPPIDQTDHRKFDTFVFRALIEYCLDTIENFKDKHYGKWPSRYPLFHIPNAEDAKVNCSLLASWLLHPGVDRTLKSLKIEATRMTLIAILVAEWSFILLGTPSKPQSSQNASGQKDIRPKLPTEWSDDWTAQSLFQLLLKQFLEPLDLSERRELLRHWNDLRIAYRNGISSRTLSEEVRTKLKWKKGLIEQLIIELRNTPTAAPKRRALTTSVSSVIHTGF